MSATVCGSEDRAIFADSRSVVSICEGNAPQNFRRAARLNRPVISAICRPDDCTVISNQRTSVCVHKRGGAEIVPLWKRVLPAPLCA